MFGAPELFPLKLLNCLHYFDWTIRSHAPQSCFLNCLISMPELPRITVLNYRLSTLELPVHYLNCHVSAPELVAHLPHKYNLNICAPTNLPCKRTLNCPCIPRTSTWANMNCPCTSLMISPELLGVTFLNYLINFLESRPPVLPLLVCLNFL
jgi:hypothetical protein